MVRVAAIARLLWTLLVVTVVLTGAAWALVWWAGWPLPDHWPSSSEWIAFAEQPLTYQNLKAAAAVIGWLLWLVLVASVGLELWARLSRRPIPLRLPEPIRLLAAGMLGTSVLAMATPTHAASTAAAVAAASAPAPDHPKTPPADPGTTTSHARTPEQHLVDHGDRSAEQPDTSDTEPSAAFHAGHGLEVPGGWIVWPVAIGVLAATATALLRRYAAPTASSLVHAIRGARHPVIDPDAPELPDPTTDDLVMLERDAHMSAQLTLGVAGHTTIGVQDLPRTGVGMTGPGRDAALRGVLAAAAVTGAAVVVPRELLHRLTAPHRPPPNVAVTADAHTAMHTAQDEIHRRHLADHNCGMVTDHPALLLLVEPPSEPRRLSALAELGSDVCVHVLVAGPWSAGATWSVDHHGHASDKHIGRLNVLDPAALAQIGQTLQIHTPPPRTILAVPQPPIPRPATPFRLAILGTPTLTTPTDPAVHIRRSGSRQIAVYLALYPDGVTRADLLDKIVGHLKTSTAAGSLNSCLYGLKQILNFHDRNGLLRDDDRYRLDPDLITVDWWQLLHHLRSGDLSQAVALYTGSVAQGYAWDWLPEHRQGARHLVADAHADLAHMASTADLALHHALTGLRIDPYAYACYEAAIQANLRLGNNEQAQVLLGELTQRRRQQA